jgi:mono/diheme cytochrome c family protein
MRHHRLQTSFVWLLLALLALFLLAACGGGGSASGGEAAEGAQSAVVPTMPPARFTAVAQQSALTHTVTLTATMTVSAAVAGEEAASVPAAPPEVLERGARSYVRNKCGDCHGAQGEGVAGKGKAIVDLMLSEKEFERMLRTGGGLGNSHIFGPSAVSPAGMSALFAFVQSFE